MRLMYTPHVIRKSTCNRFLIGASVIGLAGLAGLVGLGAWAICHFYCGNASDKSNSSMTGSLTTSVPVLTTSMLSSIDTIPPFCNRYSKITAKSVGDQRKWKKNFETASHADLNNPDKLRELQPLAFQLGTYINNQIGNGGTLLIRTISDSISKNCSIYIEKLEFIKVLLANQADPDIQDKTNKSTALMYAVEKGYLEIVELLVCAGAKLDIKNKYNMTALNYADAEVTDKGNSNAKAIRDFLVSETKRRQKIHSKT